MHKGFDNRITDIASGLDRDLYFLSYVGEKLFRVVRSWESRKAANAK
ncbi:MAG: hypothetical protein ACREAZ_00410 [Nitrososphaera sp.]